MASPDAPAVLGDSSAPVSFRLRFSGLPVGLSDVDGPAVAPVVGCAFWCEFEALLVLGNC